MNKRISSINLFRVLMVALGNGVIGWCERYISSGLAALILSLIPVLWWSSAICSGLTEKTTFINYRGIDIRLFGYCTDFSGQSKRPLSNPAYFTGMLIAFELVWPGLRERIYAKYKILNSKNVLQNAALQLFSGGIALFVFSTFLDDYTELKTVTSSSIWALVYLIIVGVPSLRIPLLCTP